jgi:hypothetical protein
VRIAAAEAAAWTGEQDAAVGVLVPLVTVGIDWRVRLEALNALTYLAPACRGAGGSGGRGGEVGSTGRSGDWLYPRRLTEFRAGDRHAL